MPNEQTLEQRIRSCMAREDRSTLLAVARQAFADDTCDEGTLAWIAGIIFEQEVFEGFELLDEFVSRHPESLHAVRAYLADAHARCERFDLAAHLARAHLRALKDAGALDRLDASPIIAEGAGRAFLVLTSVYTECGARSYSRRVLQTGLRHAVGPAWHKCYRAEIERLDAELRNPADALLNEKWESFLASGQHAAELHALAQSRGFTLLAGRIDLIEAHHRFDASYTVDANEMWLISDEIPALR